MRDELNLDLQAFAKRVYDDVLYQSTFYNFLNMNYIGELRQTGAPVIEVITTDVLEVNVRETKEIQTALDPALTTYFPILVDLTQLNMDYSIRIPLMITGSDITNAIQSAADLEDSAIAEQIDIFGYAKLADAELDEVAWNPATAEDYISLLNGLRANLFNKKIVGEYRLGLGAVEYANLVSALTSVIKFENVDVNNAVSLGEMARVYGVRVFEINDNVLAGAVGYFFNPIAIAGDTFMSAFVSTSSDIRYPGYFCMSATQSFGCEVIRGDAIVRLSKSVSA